MSEPNPNVVQMQRSQLTLMLVALDEMRHIHPESVEHYCQAMLLVAKAARLPSLGAPKPESSE